MYLNLPVCSLPWVWQVVPLWSQPYSYWGACMWMCSIRVSQGGIGSKGRGEDCIWHVVLMDRDAFHSSSYNIVANTCVWIQLAPGSSIHGRWWSMLLSLKCIKWITILYLEMCTAHSNYCGRVPHKAITGHTQTLWWLASFIHCYTEHTGIYTV